MKSVKRARGGKLKKGVETAEEEAAEEGRARGGAIPVKRAKGGAVPVQRRAGGAIGGSAEGASLAKRARGGAIASMHRGMGKHGNGPAGAPYSTARHLSSPSGGGSGKEGADSPSEVP